jgi:hypothetical protein
VPCPITGTSGPLSPNFCCRMIASLFHVLVIARAIIRDLTGRFPS